MRNHLLALALLTAAAPALATQPVVGAWRLQTPKVDALGVFLPDGTYLLAENAPTRPEHTGVEWGTYQWDPATGLVDAVALGDTNGNWGVAGDVDGIVKIEVTGADTALLSQPACVPGDCTLPLHRVPMGAGLIGAWHVPGYPAAVAFFADGGGRSVM